ncbi:TIGR03118 family protein [Vitiosangium sp. GDMCC 1.1324]|uniref:TIGR03118 family protein n=1 Tax=Vitiosangium sp. (strain GDMCC 1.1324) TaxID=2138576 RepID=UPI000D3CB278|nr:TIGR03118 family protein [Vitiosangium sp. GDMCC 1.1324]PTL81242.1 TIGR03118 family protein [Vitiosangium sp. GDMCC 1.1324]
MKVSFHLKEWRNHALALGLAASLVPAVGFAENSCKQPNAYVQRNLVADTAGVAEHTDPDLVNPWGIVFNPFGFVWISDNGTGLSTLYDGNGVKNSLVVSIPAPPGETGPGKPTGIVSNNSGAFIASRGTASGTSFFIFATEQGLIAAWVPSVDFTHALIAVDNSSTGAIYKGLALTGTGTDLHLYATDFHNGKIDVFDSTFAPFTLPPGAFTDPTIPAGFAPFGIQSINGSLYVTYAKQDADREDDVAGKGLGFVNIFDANGRLIRRLASRGKLNAPWGLALAPASFGKFGNKLLVGNFGDGLINVYDPQNGHCEGRLERPDGTPVHIDGLWGLSFGNGILDQPTDTLFFTSGPDHEAHGLYGRLDAMRRDCRGFAPESESDSDSDSNSNSN